MFAAKLGEDPIVVAGYQRRIDALVWAAIRMNAKDSGGDFDWEAAIDTNELGQAERFLQNEGVSEDEAARRHVAGLSRQQLIA